MNYKEFAEALAGYQSPFLEHHKDGSIDVEASAALTLDNLAEFANRIDQIHNTGILPLIICKYIANASTPEEKEIGNQAVEVLSSILNLNELIYTFTEPLERIAAAGRKNLQK